MTTVASRRTTAPTAVWLQWGLVGGIVAGLVFAAFEMLTAVLLDGPDAFFMPLRMIGGIGLGPSAMEPTTSLLTAGGVGLVIHMLLSAVYGVGVAAVVAAIPALRRSSTAVVITAAMAGLVLWLVNFYLVAPIAGWTWFPDATNPVVQFVAHTFAYGAVLGVLLATRARSASNA